MQEFSLRNMMIDDTSLPGAWINSFGIFFNHQKANTFVRRALANDLVLFIFRFQRIL